jgi:type II secretory pathway component PulC
LWKVELRALTTKDDANVTQFNGYLIVALRPALDWLPFDFAPGDVVTHINGVSLGQHYNAILPLFESLAQANQIDVTLRRDGEERVIRVRIEARPTPP